MRRLGNWLLGVCLTGACWGCGSSDSSSSRITIPDQFDAAFVTGEVCMPGQNKTGNDGNSTPPQYPLRFTTCLYRCVSIMDGTARITAAWSCGNGLCRMILLATATLEKVSGETKCDGNDLPAPPSDECENVTFEWMLNVPSNGSGTSRTYPTGIFRVAVPYLSMAEGQELLQRYNDGEDPATALQAVVGNQNYPDRQFNVEFQPDFAAVASPADIDGADCHPMDAPE